MNNPKDKLTALKLIADYATADPMSLEKTTRCQSLLELLNDDSRNDDFLQAFHDAATVDGELDPRAEQLLAPYIETCVDSFIADVDLLEAIEDAEQAAA